MIQSTASTSAASLVKLLSQSTAKATAGTSGNSSSVFVASGTKSTAPAVGASAGDVANPFQRMTGQTQAAMIGMQRSDRPDPSEMFAKQDTDGNGKLSRDEFVAGRPDGVSVDEAGAMFDKLASAANANDSDGLTQQQLEAGMKAQRPNGPPPGGKGGGPGGPGGAQRGGRPDPSAMASMLDANSDNAVSRDEFVAAWPDGAAKDAASTLFSSLAGDTATSIGVDKPADAMKAQKAYGRSSAATSATATAA